MSRSTSPSPQPEDGKLESIGESIHEAENQKDKEKQAISSKEPSVMESSTTNGEEKPQNPEDDGPAVEEKGVDDAPKPVEYPKGIEMFFIMLALVLTITLCSLDQVGYTAPKFHLLSIHRSPVRR